MIFDIIGTISSAEIGFLSSKESELLIRKPRREVRDKVHLLKSRTQRRFEKPQVCNTNRRRKVEGRWQRKHKTPLDATADRMVQESEVEAELDAEPEAYVEEKVVAEP